MKIAKPLHGVLSYFLLKLTVVSSGKYWVYYK